MGKNLVIVESPAKAKTIKHYLGPGYVVRASVGHVRDLPTNRMGVDVDHGFKPEYVVIRGKEKILSEIKKAAKNAVVFLAPDPDREGEAIAWHIAEEIKGAAKQIYRVLINEITKKGVTHAIRNPREVDRAKFESQQARRVLDRLVGYELSPLLWKTVRRGLSAGRVQSVAVRILVERERAILAFVQEEYWTVDCALQGVEPPSFKARVAKRNGKKLGVPDADTAASVRKELEQATYVVERVTQKQRQRRPVPPFVTAKLQQDAAQKLRFTAKRTMAAAQRLYEGVELGDEGAVGLITYMRTDSTRVSESAQQDAAAYIRGQWGAEYVPGKPNIYRTKKKAQDAHEAIRPTSMSYPPDEVKKYLRRDEARLYELIWRRFIASQMVPALYDHLGIDITAGPYQLRATGQLLKFPGWLAAWGVSADVTETQVGEGDGSDADGGYAEGRLPRLREGEGLRLLEVLPDQHFTQPPPRFTEGTLVKEMEEDGIGRPSTYAAILSTIQDKGYAEKIDGQRLRPTELGVLVTDLLVESFPRVLDVKFTAGLEDELDDVEEQKVTWTETLEKFYTAFRKSLDFAGKNMRNVKREAIETAFECEKCAARMVLKWGRNGWFLACSAYPECKNTKEATITADGKVEIIEPRKVDAEPCGNCGAEMVLKNGRYGEFLACSRYPDCKTTRPISLGVGCPRPDCNGFLTERQSRRKKVFYGCSNYKRTGCDFVLWDRPVKTPCPACGAAFVTLRGRRQTLRCHDKECGWTGEAPLPDEDSSRTGGAAPPRTRIPVAVVRPPVGPGSGQRKEMTGSPTAKKGTTKKGTAKQSAAKQSAAERSAAKKSAAKKSAAKKSAARKSAAGKSTARKSTAKKRP